MAEKSKLKRMKNDNASQHDDARKAMLTPAIVALTAISMAFSPLIVPAFAAKSDIISNPFSSEWNTQFTPSGVDSNLAKLHEQRVSDQKSGSDNELFRFTPAGLDKITNRTLTVAARTNTDAPKAVEFKTNLVENSVGKNNLAALKTTKYSLKQDKGWKGFQLAALPKVAVTDTVGTLNRISTDITNFKLNDDKDNKPSKFQSTMRIAKPTEAAPSPLGNAAGEDYVLSLGGSFSISKRIDLTAGVRYDRQNDIPLASSDDREDSEAVYVGTKIRF